MPKINRPHGTMLSQLQARLIAQGFPCYAYQPTNTQAMTGEFLAEILDHSGAWAHVYLFRAHGVHRILGKSWYTRHHSFETETTKACPGVVFAEYCFDLGTPFEGRGVRLSLPVQEP